MNKREAQMAGEVLLSKMNGKGWNLEVWENLGGHYRIYKGGMTVYPIIQRGSVTYGTLFKGAGEIFLNKSSFSTDPNEAVRLKLLETLEHVIQVENAIHEVLS